MKRKRFSVEHITTVLQQAESGVLIGDLGYQVGISEQSFYRWRKVYRNLQPSEARELKPPRDENKKLKRLPIRLSAVPPYLDKPKQPQESKTPRVAELLRKALAWRALLTSGEVSNQATIARREGITRARVTQILGLLRLAPEIQDHILSMPRTVGRPTISERVLRSITMLEDQQQQLHSFADILSK